MDPEPSLFISNYFQDLSADLLIAVVACMVLLVLSALISGAEVAFFSLAQPQLNKASESKQLSERTVVELLEEPKQLLATILITNNFINILIVLLFAFIGDFVFGPNVSELLKFLIEVVLATFLILLFGEVLPKVYASRNSMRFAALMALPLKLLLAVTYIVSKPLMWLTNTIEKKLNKKQSNLSVEKLSQALKITSDEATTTDEQKILEGIVSFGNTETSQIMTPRIDIFALEDTTEFSEVILGIVENGYSRIPVYTENIDSIIGVLYAKDLLPHLNKKTFNWNKLLRPPYFVPENKKLDDLLKEFQEKKNHLAVVVDEYGGTSGIVSLEDVIEEIVGDINDEFDDEDLSYSKINDNSYLFEGKTNLKDFARILELDSNDVIETNKGESETIAGFVLEICGRFPKKDEEITFENFTFKIEAMDRKRIKKVKVTVDRN